MGTGACIHAQAAEQRERSDGPLTPRTAGYPPAARGGERATKSSGPPISPWACGRQGGPVTPYLHRSGRVGSARRSQASRAVRSGLKVSSEFDRLMGAGGGRGGPCPTPSREQSLSDLSRE
jgi:hypothetical protein